MNCPMKRKRSEEGDTSSDPNDLFITGDDDLHRHDNDADSDQDDEGGYSERIEPLPNAAAYDTDFKGIVERATLVPGDFVKLIGQHGCQTEDVAKLLEQARAMQRVPDADLKMIGLVGDAGQGKSSFLNALIDVPDLAKAVALGKSVTFVPMIYQRAEDCQLLRLSATIEYFDRTAITKLLEQALYDWYMYNFEKDSDWSEEEDRQRHDKSATTESIFQSVFCNTAGFSDLDGTRDTLRKVCRHDSKLERKAAPFVDIVQGVLESKFPSGNYSAYFEASHQRDLEEWLDPQLAETEMLNEPSMWPFVKQVVIGVRGSRVLDRWKVVDLPGLSDTHKIRVDATKKHVHDCDYLFVVGEFGRIVTNPTVRNVIRDYGMAFMGNISLVVTKCDECLDRSVCRELGKKNQHLKSLAADWENTSRLHAAGIRNVKSGKYDGEQSLGELEDAYFRSNNTFWETFYLARLPPVRDQLLRQYSQYLPKESSLEVFFVSNTHYKALKGSQFERRNFQLSAAATGIPEVRSYLLALASPATVQNVETFVEHKLALFIDGCDLWASSELSESRYHLISVVKKPRTFIPETFRSCSHAVHDSATELIVDKLVTKQSEFASDAWKIVQRFRKELRHSTIKAFILRYGHHKTPSMQQSWDFLFTDSIRRCLNMIWDHFITEVLERLEKLRDDTLDQIGMIMRLLTGEKAAISLPTEKFDAYLKAEQAGLRRDHRIEILTLSQGLKSILLKMTRDEESVEDHEDAGEDVLNNHVFAKAMKNTYDQCKVVRGKGARDKILGILQRRVATDGDDSPFAKVTIDVETEIKQALDRFIRVYKNSVDRTFDRITERFTKVVTGRKPCASESSLRAVFQAPLPKAFTEVATLSHKLREIKARYSEEGLGS